MGHDDPHGFAIGIDGGGTKTAGDLVDLRTGAVSHWRRIATPTGDDGSAAVAAVTAMVQTIMALAESPRQAPVALGLGLAELVNRDGAILSGHRTAWKGRDVVAALSVTAGVYSMWYNQDTDSGPDHVERYCGQH